MAEAEGSITRSGRRPWRRWPWRQRERAARRFSEGHEPWVAALSRTVVAGDSWRILFSSPVEYQPTKTVGLFFVFFYLPAAGCYKLPDGFFFTQGFVTKIQSPRFCPQRNGTPKLIWKPFLQQSLKTCTLSIHFVSFAVTEMNHPECPRQGSTTVKDKKNTTKNSSGICVHNTLMHVNEDPV
jgi:hypothetical protein